MKLTVKSMEDALQRKIGSRKATLSQLTAKKNEMLRLMDDDSNLEVIKTELVVEFSKLFREFCELNVSVKELLQKVTSEEEVTSDQEKWFRPKSDSFKRFSDDVEAWIDGVHGRMKEAREVDETIKPSDSISKVSSQKSKKSYASSSRSASSARLQAELEKAALLAKAATLKKKEALEKQEVRLKAEREELELHTALAAADAKLKVLDKYEEDAQQKDNNKQLKPQEKQPAIKEGHGESGKDHDVIAEHRGNTKHKRKPPPLPNAAQSLYSATSDADDESLLSSSSADSVTGAGALPTVRRRQRNITDLLIKQQKLSTLPPQNIPIFKGDPLEFRLFVRAFEHGVEGKTESSRDRLYFMEQYTSGQPRELIRSCLHMDPDKGYRKAKKLLKEHFGNEYRISVAYIDKALSWPTIKADDGEGLNALALFLTSCSNAMSDLDYMEELDNVANMHCQ